MEPVPLGRAHHWPRLLRYLWRGQPDLQQAFPLTARDSYPALLAWYRVHAPGRFPAAPALPPDAIALSETSIPASTAAANAVHLSWTAAALAGIDRRAARTLSVERRRAIADWYVGGGWAGLPKLDQPSAAPPPGLGAGLSRAELARLPPGARGGVNLCGYARGELGIGEDLRSMSASLDSAGVPHVILDAGRPGQAREQDTSLDPRIVAQPVYPVTIFCLTPFDTARLYLEQGPALFTGTYRIGSWAWELPDVPALLDSTFALVDEVWAHSRYSLAAYRKRKRRPSHFMPPSVVLPEMGPLAARRRGALFTFIVPFDPNSYLAHKNPIAAVQAFQAAFPASDREVALTLRVNGMPGHSPAWDALVRAVGSDARIRIVTGTLARREALGLLAASDCLVSPHRAEGFGRNIAEAICLGVPVLATGFSGCVDFLEAEESVPWTERPIQAGEYPFGDGLWWAEPDIAALADAMVRVRRTARQPGRRTHLAQRAAWMADQYGTAAAGRRYAKRLQAIGALVQA